MKILLLQKMAGISGSEIYFMNLLPELNRRGVAAEFCCVQHPANAGKNEKFLAHLEAQGVRYHIINSRWPVSPRLLWRLHRLIRKERFDLVQTNLIHADLWGALIKRFFNPTLKLVSVKHGYDEGFQQRFGFDHTKLRRDRFYRISKFANRYMNHNAAISEGLADLLVKGGLAPAEKMDVIHYGFDFSDKKAAADSTPFRFGQPQLVIVGRLIPVKQHHLVLQILPALLARFPQLKLVLVGAGEREQALQQLAADLGVGEQVIFAGFRTNIHDYIAASDLMLVPSSAEGFGVVILEGWHNRKPVIAFDVPAPNEIIRDGENGLLVPPFDTTILQQRIETLLSDPDAARRMGEAGYAILQQQFTMAVMVAKTLALYQKAMV